MTKYKLTDETIKRNGTTLYRIVALKSFSNVKTGQLGGYVQSLDNLAQTGDCWIYGDARVFGNARVWSDALVFGDARVFGDAWIYDGAKVYGNVRVYGSVAVYGDARVYGNAVVRGNARVYGNATVHGDAIVYSDKHTYINENIDYCWYNSCKSRLIGLIYTEYNTRIQGENL